MLLGKFEGNHERAGYIYVLEIVPGTPAAGCADIDLQACAKHTYTHKDNHAQPPRQLC